MDQYIQFNEEIFEIKIKDKNSLFINRNDITLNNEFQKFSNKLIKIEFLNLIGFYLIEKTYFCAISTKLIPIKSQFNIFNITEFKVLQISNGPLNEEGKSLIEKGLQISPLYLSTNIDLSLTLPLQFLKNESRSLFIWNNESINLFKKLFNNNNLITPIISGFIASFEISNIQFLLISRRSSKRVGTRFWIRGSDEEGYVANFVETEQIITINEIQYSFIQIRGSIPIYWTQYPDLSRLPSIKVGDNEENEKRFKKHFQLLHELYGNIIVISLTDINGKEKEITSIYNNLGLNDSNINFHYFDFHKECSKMRYNNINKLINQIEEEIKLIGWTEINNNKLIQKQNGIIRTNCIDCLDRTNVVQSIISKKIIENQIKNISIEFDSLFRGIWTDNADFLSLQYAGTPALKTDFTRTGKRSKIGMLNDGKNSIKRYFINTCEDGLRQDSYDIINQNKEIKSLEKDSFLISLLKSFLMLIISILLILTGNLQKGKRKLLDTRMKLVNTPRFLNIKFPEKKLKFDK